MKMKLNVALVAGALALSMAGQAANAAIVTSNGLADQLFLSVWDSVSGTSYTRGLGLTGTNLITGAGINFGAATTGSGFSATGGGANYSLAADANLTSFLAGATMANLVWSVVAGDVSGGLVYGQSGYLTTSNNMVAPTDATMTGMGSTAAYIQSVNALMPATVMGSTDSIVSPGGTTSSALSGLMAGFGTAPFSSTAALGSSQNFFLLTPAFGSRGYNGNALSYQFASTTGTAASWTLGANGNLTYTVAAVPEPGEWLLMLSGLGLIGFIATRRRNNEGGMTFA